MEVFLWFVLLFALILVGSTVIYSNEDGCGTFGSYNEAFYFSAITATGIGYGDFTLQRDSSIVFNIFYILVSVSLTATAMEKAATLSMRIEQAEVPVPTRTPALKTHIVSSSFIAIVAAVARLPVGGAGARPPAADGVVAGKHKVLRGQG